MKIQELFENDMKKEIVSFFKNYRAGTPPFQFKLPFGKYSINSNNEISMENELFITKSMLVNDELPFKFENTGLIEIRSSAREIIKSFKNFPNKITFKRTNAGRLNSNSQPDAALYSYQDCPNITSLEGIPREVIGTLYLNRMPNLNYHNVHEYFDSIDGNVLISGEYVGPLLGFLKIPKLKTMRLNLTFAKNPNTVKAVHIIEKYLTDPSKKRDVWKCQDELQDNDLDEYADL